MLNSKRISIVVAELHLGVRHHRSVLHCGHTLIAVGALGQARLVLDADALLEATAGLSGLMMPLLRNTINLKAPPFKRSYSGNDASTLLPDPLFADKKVGGIDKRTQINLLSRAALMASSLLCTSNL